LYNKFKDVFDEFGLTEEFIKLLNNMEDLLSALSSKAAYNLKIEKTREFMGEVDRFRVFSSKYLGRISEELYRDIKEIIDGVFNFDIEGGVDEGV
jgi:hypothetical protein